MFRPRSSFGAGVPLILLLLAACSGGDPTPTPTPTPAAPALDGGASGSGPGSLGLTWEIEDVDAGGKPALALDSQGVPFIAYMEEAQAGFVKAAVRRGSGWEIETIATGYFYGPLDIAVGNDDVAHVAYHDHQAASFDPDLGDAAYAVRAEGGWTTGPVMDEGHDGWDNRITTDADGRPHMAGVDPVEFGGVGVEYYSLDADGNWTVEAVGSGPQTYQFGVSVAIAADGTPYITYYSQQDDDLAIAVRTDTGWDIDFIEQDGDVGLFSELLIDETGRFHVSYLLRTGSSTGTVRYATRASADEPWAISDVGELDAIVTGQVGARNITSVAVDSRGTPWVAYSDTATLFVAGLDGAVWRTQRVAESGAQPLGQLVSLGIDADDGLHVAYFEGRSPGPIGTVKYAKGTPAL